MKKYLTRLAAALLAAVLLTAPAGALTVEQALELLEEIYYYDIPEAAYSAGTVDAVVEALGDPYTDYMTQEEYEAFLGELEGATGAVGIGVAMEYTEQGILVTEALSGGSAQSAGLQAGDLIVEVNGVSCVPAQKLHRDLILGEEGTTVVIKILRDGEVREYSLARRPVMLPNTQIRLLEGGIGYIDCSTFGQETGHDFAKGLQEFDGMVDWWVLDLRSNGGGYTDSAVEMLSALAGPGRYLYYEDAEGGLSYQGSPEGGAASRKPVVILTNGYSASASEVVAAGVRDLERGIIVGSRTYGKGVAQTMCDKELFPEYFDGDGLKVTFARFYSAGFNTTDRIGVIPTLLVDDAYAGAVALALFGREDESTVSLVMGGTSYFIDPKTDSEVLAALFQALPPQAQVFYDADGVFRPCTPLVAAESMGVSYSSRWFTDVADSGYADAINAMATYGLLNGLGNGKFSPDGTLTRAQLCSMLVRVLNIRYSGANQFSDVPDNAWYAQAVNTMAASGLVNGVGDGLFDPAGRLTQEQFLAIMGRVARFINVWIGSYGDWLESADAWLDAGQTAALAPYSEWAKSDVAVLAWGIEDAMDGNGDMLYTQLGNIDPEAAVLREEAAAGMYAVLAGLEILP